jgi:D-alanine-D-alanine ligase
MGRRLRVGILYGGRSGEHEISLRSAIAVIRALDPSRYDAVPIAITKAGRWLTGPRALAQLERAQRALEPIPTSGEEIALLAEPTRRGFLKLGGPLRAQRLDVVFPVLHGTYGEDGTIQGLLELAGLPYVGAGVLGSSVGMDKDVMKRLLRERGLPVGRFITVRGRTAASPRTIAERLVEADIGYPCFVKPANMGSSVGISKVKRAAELPGALRTAARYDTKVVIEEAILGREFEIGVIGNNDGSGALEVSVPGEVIPGREFYDYVDKYVGEAARTIVPATLHANLRAELTGLAKRAYEALECDGFARVDFFLRETDERLLINEINTIPGMTPISLFPQMWEATGVPFPAVVERLIALGLARHRQRARLATTFAPGRVRRSRPGSERQGRRRRRPR